MCQHDEMERVNILRQIGYYPDTPGRADCEDTWIDEPYSCKCGRYC